MRIERVLIAGGPDVLPNPLPAPEPEPPEPDPTLSRSQFRPCRTRTSILRQYCLISTRHRMPDRHYTRNPGSSVIACGC